MWSDQEIREVTDLFALRNNSESRGQTQMALHHRFKILWVTWDTALSTTAIYRRIGLSQSGTSHHLSFLWRAGYLDCRQSGKNRLYSVSAGGRMKVRKIFKLLAILGGEGTVELFDQRVTDIFLPPSSS